MLSKKINIAIIGATGYVGLDLIYLLSKHPNANIKYIYIITNTLEEINTKKLNYKKKKRFVYI